MVYIASMAAMTMTGEHAQDVLGQLKTWQESGQDCALVIVVETQGGAVRAPGALLAISPDDSIGYISGGCIDADVIMQARQACTDCAPKRVRYGAGSPFVDLPLPCGGAIIVQIIPNPEPTQISRAHQVLVERKQLCLALTDAFEIRVSENTAETPAEAALCFRYAPKLRLRIAGRGADALALAKMSDAAGYETLIQLLDEDDIASARSAGIQNVHALETASDLAPSDDDPWSAFVLLFHDQDWEIPLLQQALSGSAFYIGAVGSRTTHEKRCAALKAANCSEKEVERVRGPIGLVPSLRDASFLAISILSEIIETFPGAETAARQNTGLLMLAAGASSRFEDGDKLLAKLDGKPVLEHAASLSVSPAAVQRVAVTGDAYKQRERVLSALSWEIVRNPDAHEGQSSSLIRGLEALSSNPDVDQVILLLGDMPHIPESHLSQMLKLAEQNRVTAIMSECDGVLCPPALFKRKHFEDLAQLTGDRGAKSVFLAQTSGTVTLPLAKTHGRDIDRVADLKPVAETAHA